MNRLILFFFIISLSCKSNTEKNVVVVSLNGLGDSPPGTSKEKYRRESGSSLWVGRAGAELGPDISRV